MKPLLALLAAVAALAALLWASARDLRQPWTAIPTPDPDDDMAGVQVDVRPHLMLRPSTSGGDFWPFDIFVVPPDSTQTGPLGPTA